MAENRDTGRVGTRTDASRGDDFALDDDRLTLMGLLVESYAGLGARVEPQIAEHGLVSARFEVLMRLARTPGHTLRMSDLAAQTNFSLSGLTRAVDRLVDQGLVVRRSCPTDRRGSFAELTEAGRLKVAEVLPAHLELIDEWLTAPFDEAELAQLTQLLRKLRDHVHPHAETVTPERTR